MPPAAVSDAPGVRAQRRDCGSPHRPTRRFPGVSNRIPAVVSGGLVRRPSARHDVRVEWIAVVLVLVALAGAMAGLTFLARRIRRRGAAGQAIAEAVAAFDEGFRSTGHDTVVGMQAQDERGGSARSEDL